MSVSVDRLRVAPPVTRPLPPGCDPAFEPKTNWEGLQRPGVEVTEKAVMATRRPDEDEQEDDE